MPDTSRMIPLVSAATLALVIGQGAFADPQATEASQTPAEPTNEAAPAPAPASAPAAAPADASSDAPTPGEAARAKAEERRADMMAEREKRYEELRARAAEIGLALPEMPPWESTDRPPMPERRGMSPEDMEAMRQQRQEMREQMRSMTPEERRAMRDAHWQQMRADAAERGVEMPEMPRMPPQYGGYEREGYGYGYGPQGGYPGGMPYPGRAGMGHPPMMPDYDAPGYGVPGYDQGPPQGMGY